VGVRHRRRRPAAGAMAPAAFFGSEPVIR
jgi:hypothetical protein